MTRSFDYFVIFAEMRTGSNFLESNLSLFPGLATYGEAFNPYFMVEPKLEELFGVTVEARNADPIRLIEKMRDNTDGIPGFRFFHDHDVRVYEHVIEDPRCAKVVLTRNFVDSYVSRKIARATDQWQLGNVRDAKHQKIRFEPAEFLRQFAEVTAFQHQLQKRLQSTGQSAFYLAYEDTQDLEVVNGLARFLGETTRLEGFSGKHKKQNPEALEEKVVNFDELVETVQSIGLFDVEQVPVYEPRRSPLVPNYVTAAKAPLLFMPIEGAPGDEVLNWMAALDGVGRDGLATGMTQKDLRKWKRSHPGHRSFTVVRHPALRAHAAFCRHFLSNGPSAYPEIREALRSHYDVPLPESPVPGPDYDRVAHRAAFLAFLKFLKSNLDGQTSIRVDGAWATQSAIIQGFGQVLLPDHILREDDLEIGLTMLAKDAGLSTAGALPKAVPDAPFTLAEIYDDEIEEAVRRPYQRDFMQFGFRPWRKGKSKKS